MTEPVAGVPSVRRTVRVAVALLAGQALLCAVIGWLTFGPSPAHRGRANPVDPLAAPPLVAPMPYAAPLRTSAATAPSTPTSTSATVKKPRSRPPRLVIASPRLGLPPFLTRSPIASTRPIDPVPPIGDGPEVATLPPPPAPGDDVQEPVTVGADCNPEAALGRTSDGTMVRCVRDTNGNLRWEIV